PLAADYLADVLHQEVQEPELTIGEIRDRATDARLPAGQVQLELANPDHGSLVRRARPAQVHPRARQQLVEGEGLGDVVDGSEFEAPQLRGEVTARREDQDRQLSTSLVQLLQRLESAAPGQ